MNNIPAALRTWQHRADMPIAALKNCLDAANEIDRLRAELAAMKAQKPVAFAYRFYIPNRHDDTNDNDEYSEVVYRTNREPSPDAPFGRRGYDFDNAADTVEIALYSAPLSAQVLPVDVMAALDRMCTPLDDSWLGSKTATAKADAHSMNVIRDYVLRTAVKDSLTTASPAPDLIAEAVGLLSVFDGLDMIDDGATCDWPEIVRAARLTRAFLAKVDARSGKDGV